MRDIHLNETITYSLSLLYIYMYRLCSLLPNIQEKEVQLIMYIEYLTQRRHTKTNSSGFYKNIDESILNKCIRKFIMFTVSIKRLSLFMPILSKPN